MKRVAQATDITNCFDIISSFPDPHGNIRNEVMVCFDYSSHSIEKCVYMNSKLDIGILELSNRNLLPKNH